MPRMSIDEEVAALVSLAPSQAKLAETAECLETVLERIHRDGDEWFVHPSLDHLARKRGPGALLRSAQRGMKVLRRAQEVLRAGTPMPQGAP